MSSTTGSRRETNRAHQVSETEQKRFYRDKSKESTYTVVRSSFLCGLSYVSNRLMGRSSRYSPPYQQAVFNKNMYFQRELHTRPVASGQGPACDHDIRQWAGGAGQSAHDGEGRRLQAAAWPSAPRRDCGRQASCRKKGRHTTIIIFNKFLKSSIIKCLRYHCFYCDILK